MTQMQSIWDGFIGMVGALAVLAGFVGAVEALFRPIRRSIERRDQRIEAARRTAAVLERVERHMDEDERVRKRMAELEATMARHQKRLEHSRNERELLWRAVRAIIAAMTKIAPDDQALRDSLHDMDDYANKNMR